MLARYMYCLAYKWAYVASCKLGLAIVYRLSRQRRVGSRVVDMAYGVPGPIEHISRCWVFGSELLRVSIRYSLHPSAELPTYIQIHLQLL